MNPCCSATLAHLYTAAMVAETLGCHRSYIAHLAQRLKVGVDVGTSGRVRVYTPEDVDRMREYMGRPT